MSPLLLMASALLAATPTPWLLYIDLARDEATADIVAARPDEKKSLLTLDILPNHAPHARLSPEGGTLFFTRHTVPNHLERTGELVAFDLKRRATRLVAQNVDAEPPLALSDDAVAWFETIETRPAQESDEFDRATIALFASADGERRELVRFRDIYGAHFAGIADNGIVLYVVTPKEAAFYLLPLDRRFIEKSRAPVRESSRQTPVPRAAIEAEVEGMIPSGLTRLAAAPTGPVAREFTVRGDRLFFGALTRDRTESALYSLTVPGLDELNARGDSDSAPRLVTQKLALTGKRSPAPIVTREGLLYARAEGSGEALRRRDWASLKAAGDMAGVPATRQSAGNARAGEQKLLRTRGTMRALCADSSGKVIAVRRAFEGQAELLWIEPDSGTTRRIRTREINEAIGFVEGIE